MSQNLMNQSVLESPMLDDTKISDAETTDLAQHNETIDGLPMEAYARPLLDEMFEDVEHLLEGGVTYQPELPVEAETAIAASPISFDLNSAAAEPSLSVSITAPKDSAISQMIHRLQPKPNSDSVSVAEGQSVDRLLLIIGSLAAIVTLGTWFLHYQLFRKSVPLATTSPEAAVMPSIPDPQFASYLSQALKNLDQRQQPASSTTDSASAVAGIKSVPPSPTVLPTVTIPLTPAAVPPPPTVTTSPPQQVLPFPLSKLPTSVPAVIPLPKLPFNPVQRFMQPNQTASRPETVSALPTTPNQTLVGVLDLGTKDRSTALIEISGVAQRFRVGESIGKGGWTLVEVSKNQVTVRRNGEVRTVFVGQSF